MIILGDKCVLFYFDMNNERYDEEKAKKLENHYVHDVYSAQALSYDGLCDGPWPEIKKFLFNLQPGSFVADVGKYCDKVVKRFF